MTDEPTVDPQRRATLTANRAARQAIRNTQMHLHDAHNNITRAIANDPYRSLRVDWVTPRPPGTYLPEEIQTVLRDVDAQIKLLNPILEALSDRLRDTATEDALTQGSQVWVLYRQKYTIQGGRYRQRITPTGEWVEVARSQDANLLPRHVGNRRFPGQWVIRQAGDAPGEVVER